MANQEAKTEASAKPVRYMRAYFHTFTPTGVDSVDAILEAIAEAGKAFHYTGSWDDADEYGPDGYWGHIQSRANAAASLNAELLAATREALALIGDLTESIRCTNRVEALEASLRAVIARTTGASA